MKRSARLISLILAAMMLLPACAKDEGEGESTTANPSSGDPTGTTAPVEEETTIDPNLRANHFDALPEDLNFNGKTVTCLFRGTMGDLDGSKSGFWIRNDVCGSDSIGDSVSDAVWERNATVAERLSIDLQWVPTDGGSLENDKAVFRQIVMSSDDSYQFFLPTGNTSAQAGLTSYMRDISNIPYVDWDSPWWWQFANEALSIDGKSMQFVVGDMLLTNLAQTCVMYFNKDLYTDIIGDPDDLYQLTLDGGFTLDVLYEYVQQAYKDANGNGIKDEGDTFGLLWSDAKTEELAGYVAGCGLDLYTRDESGALTITMNNDRTITAIDTLYRLMNENEGSFARSGTITDQAKPFSEGVSLFLEARLIIATSETLREMEQEYGILPTPKLDEDQNMYYSGVHESGTVLCVPKSVGDEDFAVVGAVMEALCGEAHRSYIDTFLESALKMKYSRDALSGKCIDLVLDGLTKNTLQEYSNYTNDITNTCLYNPIKSNPSSFTAAFRKLGTVAQKTWNKAVESLES